MIKIRNLFHTFGQQWVLNNLSFDLSAGDFLFLTGRSGAGKSTLLNILHGGLKMRGGQASVAGYDLRSLHPGNLHQLRRKVSIVVQDFKILPAATVYENIALPLEVRGMPKDKIHSRVKAVMRSLHLEKKQYCFCQELSGGEQQRVATARAIVVSPALLLADEPTGNLDLGLARHLLDVFKYFNQHQTTIIMATHNTGLVSSMSSAKILTLEQGKIADANFQLPHGQQP